MFSQCRQMNGCEGKVEEAVAGTKGTSNCKNWIRGADKQLAWRFRENDTNPYQQEHQDLIDSIRQGQPLNEAKAVAESTLTGIMGRESAYCGRTVEWDAEIIHEEPNKVIGWRTITVLSPGFAAAPQRSQR